MKKLYVINKYVAAESAIEAIQQDHKTPIHDVYIHDGWKGGGVGNLNRAVKLPTKIADDDSFLEEIN